jgi:hypothetical protein
MLDFIILLCLSLEIFLISYIDRKIHGTLFTPINVLALPYLLLVVIAFFFSKKLNFVGFYAPSMIIWIIGLLIFWLPSLIFNFYLHSNKIFLSRTIYYLDADDIHTGFTKFLFVLSWISIAVVVFGFSLSLKKFGIKNIGSEEFSRFYGSGISGHFIVLNVLLFIYFFGIAHRNNSFILATLGFLFLTFILYQVKTWVFIPLFSGIFYRSYRGNFKLQFKTIWVTVLFSIGFFFSTYYFSIGLQTKFLFKHMVTYAFSGIMGLSEFIREPVAVLKDSTFLIRPVENIFRVIFDLPVKNVIQKVMTNISGQSDILNMTNVRTFFGTIYLNSGILISIIYVFLISAVIYYFYILSILRKNKWVILFSSFLLGALIMGWFDFYFNTLNFFELPVYILILDFFSKVRLKRRVE